MKTRIISGIVLALIVTSVLLAGFLWEPVVIAIMIAVLAAGAVYELLHNAVGIKNKIVVYAASTFAFLIGMTLTLGGEFYESVLKYGFIVCVAYEVFAAIIILWKHSEFDLKKIIAFFSLPVPYAFAFASLGGIIMHKHGIYYLLLLINFASVCDMGAYFVGSFFGKHKLCPNISPKKTVEGAVGGVASSIIFTVIIALSFSKSLLLPLLFTIPLCILGMVGDLFASAIKRSVGIKDYGNLIPGHGGILDRFDSIIMIAPLMFVLVEFNLI